MTQYRARLHWAIGLVVLRVVQYRQAIWAVIFDLAVVLVRRKMATFEGMFFSALRHRPLLTAPMASWRQSFSGKSSPSVNCPFKHQPQILIPRRIRPPVVEK